MVARTDYGLLGGLAKLTPCERFRRSRGWSMVRLAGLAGVSINTIGAIEHARVSGLRIETLMSVANTLGVSCVDLIPGLSVRHSEGRAQRVTGGERKAAGRARRELVKRTLLEKLQGAGGRMRGCDAVAQVAERCRVPGNYVRSVRVECGVECVRLPGRGPDAWEWRLAQSSVDSADRT